MFLNKLFLFLKGYVILYITGFNIERFIYICARRKISLFNILKDEKNKAVLTVSISDFFRIRDIAVKTHTRVHILKKAGLPILWKKYKKRYFFIGGAVFFCLFLFLSSQFFWSVEITGVENADIVKITKVLKNSGIYVGAPKCRSASPKEIKNALLNRVDNISWAWVYKKGTKAICEIYEGTLPKYPLSPGEPCSIFACRDGIIEEIITTKGKEKVSEGSSVTAGDLLISGIIVSPDGTSCKVPASGLVKARTWHEKTDTYKLYREKNIPTGRKKHHIELDIFSKKLKFYRNKPIPFRFYSVSEQKHELKTFGDNFFGIALTVKSISENDVIKEILPYDTAVYMGKCDLEKRISREIVPGAKLITSDVSSRLTDKETVEVTVRMEFIERIGEKVPIDLQE